MKEININVFNNRKDNRVKSLPTTWDIIIEHFTSPHEINENKSDSKLFNGIRYKNINEVPEYSDDWVMDAQTGISYVKRRQVNIIENDLLVLDYDGGITLDEVLDRFKEYEFVYYTSYRHLYDGETEKFRIIFPFLKPIPSWKKFNEYNVCIDFGEWYQITESLKTFAGPCDPTSFNANTMYHMPSVHHSRVHLSRSGHNQGRFLDWDMFEKIPFDKIENNQFTSSSSNNDLVSTEYLEPDQVLQTENGPIIVSEVIGLIKGVFCPSPLHNDKKGTEFARKVESTGNIFVHCNTCQKNFYMKKTLNSQEEVVANREKSHKRHPNEDRVYTIDELLEYPDEKIHYAATDRDRVTKQLEKIKNIIDKDKGYATSTKHPVYSDLNLRKYKSHILYMPEGSGKSHLVINMAKDGQKIIFACKSWEQVESKYDEYKRIGIQEGFNVRIIRSKDAKARKRFKTKLSRLQQKHPFSSPQILDEESIEEFIKNNPDLSPQFIRLSWEFFLADRLSFESIPHPEIDKEGIVRNEYLSPPVSEGNTRIVLTTFEQLRIHRLRNIKIPKDWIIWFDDPDIMDVVDIERYDTEKWGELPEEEFDKKTIDINGRRYFRRDREQSLGYSLRKYKCIYTTTEIITRQAIELMMNKRHEEFIVHDQMDNITGGKITILGTNMVRKRFDGIIPLLVRRLTKKKHPTLLIADGLSSELNHSNNKGRNDLNHINLLVELSIPHPNQIKTICDSLDLPFVSNRNEITQSIILDRLHQAIGRNSGYRWKGYQCVALVDSQVHRKIVDKTRYKIDNENSVLIDRTKNMSRKDKRTSKTVSPIVQEIERILNNLGDYISDYRIIKADITYVIKSIKDFKKKTDYIVRLLVSLTQLSGIDINEDYTESDTLSFLQQKYLELIAWILETHIPDGYQVTIIQQVQKMISELE